MSLWKSLNGYGVSKSIVEYIYIYIYIYIISYKHVQTYVK